MDGERWLATYRVRLAEIGARTARAREALAGVEATASSPDGAVTVTVDSSGSLQRLVLGERTEQMTRVQLAEAVVATARQAQGEAARQAAEAVAPLVGQEAVQALHPHLAPVRDTR